MTAEDPARWWVRWSSVGLLATAWVGSCPDVATAALQERAYYVSPAGNDGNPGTQDAPFGTISHGLDVVAPGDTIVVRDGVYAEALTPHTSGTSGAPITLRAEHDGQAVVDGLGVRRPLVVQGVSHTAYEGLVFVNSNHSVVMVITSDQTPTGVPSTHNVFRRVSAYNVFGTGNDHIIEVDWSGDNLFEDCVAAGRGRTTIANFGSVGNTFRRCWMRGDEGTGSNCGSNIVFTNYLSSESLYENMIAAQPVDNPGPCAAQRDVSDWANTYGTDENTHNRYYGSISTDLQLSGFNVDAVQFKHTRDHVYQDCVVLYDGTHGANGINDLAGDHVTYDHLTLVGNGTTYVGFDMRASLGCDDPRCDGTGSPFPFTSSLQRSVIEGFYYAIAVTAHDNTNGCLAHTENVLSNNHGESFDAGANTVISSTTMPCPGTKGLDPTERALSLTWATVTYGRGAYLLGATNAPRASDGRPAGAQVLYRYQDGTRTTVPLWPFPMEDRVWQETARYTRHQQSPTWDGVVVNGEQRTGGYWKTLAGVYHRLRRRRLMPSWPSVQNLTSLGSMELRPPVLAPR
jgi:hypothetical protein